MIEERNHERMNEGREELKKPLAYQRAAGQSTEVGKRRLGEKRLTTA
jgi:hypothetical protein